MCCMTIRAIRYTYRLRPSASTERALVRENDLTRAVWNHLVAESKHRHEQKRTFDDAGLPTLYTDAKGKTRDYFEFGAAEQSRFLTMLRRILIREDGTKWMAEGSADVQQQMVRDFAAARQKALMDRKNLIPVAQRRGLPRFKSRHTDLPSLNYSKDGFKFIDVDGALRLKLAGGIIIPVVWSRDLPSTPKSVRVYRDSLGHWYASFVVQVELASMPGPLGDTALGVDWGVAEVATTATVDTSTGEIDESTTYDLVHPQFREKSAAPIAKQQRKMARRKRPKGQPKSKGYQKAQRDYAKAHKKVANQRKDAGHKWARQVARQNRQIAVEDFRPRFLSQTTMAAKSADAGIAMLKAILIWQALVAGADLRLVDPRNTTTDCANCDARTKHRLPLGQRTYTCESCGVSRPRDKNSAAIMVARAGFDPAGAEGVRPPESAETTGHPEPGIPRL